MPQQNRFVDPLNLWLFAMLAAVVLGWLIVSRWDYEDARLRECAAKGQAYDFDKDKCYGKTEENRQAR